jgi:uncharacterized protein
MFRISRQTGEYAYLVRNEYTGEKHEVCVAEHLRHLFDDEGIFALLPEACPFFRRNDEDGRYYCTVHTTRPDVCREYGCWRFLILDREGRRAGRVMGTRHLHAEDPDLMLFWDERIRTLHITDDQEWDRVMADIVRSAGYTIRV